MVKLESVKVWETTGREERRELVRASVVESVLAGLEAARLSTEEYLVVVGAIHARIAKEATGASAIVVTATATTGYPVRASSRTVVKETMGPELVCSTVEKLVRAASPELWAQILDVLEASDVELAQMRAARDPAA